MMGCVFELFKYFFGKDAGDAALSYSYARLFFRYPLFDKIWRLPLMSFFSVTSSVVKKTPAALLVAVLLVSFVLPGIAQANSTSIQPVAEASLTIEAISTVNVNTATAEQISSALKGIGLKKAQAIIEWRESNGGFAYIEQLLAVKGIGEKILSDNRSLIAL